jgi:hypothetical protein
VNAENFTPGRQHMAPGGGRVKKIHEAAGLLKAACPLWFLEAELGAMPKDGARQSAIWAIAATG